MRSAVMILALLLVLGGVFFFVVLRDRPAMYTSDAASQAATRPTSRAVVPSTIATLHPEESLVGQSAGVWIQSLDRVTGLVAKEFNFERLDPRKDDNVDVTHPRARFYNNNGSIITLEGTDGVVVYTQGGSHADPKAMGNATPDNGVFRNVTIRVFDHSLDDKPSTVAQLPAVRFDANDNRIATVDSVIDGKGVLADQVPVKVRGDDYEFDGRGLTMRWNDRDGRLEELHVQHGERLLIRDINKFDAGTHPTVATQPTGPTEPTEPTSLAPAFGMSDLFDGLVMAQPTTDHVSAASKRRAAERAAAAASRPATPPPPTTRRVKGQALYFAQFEQNVRVFRAGVLIATADTMNVVLPSSGEKPADDATTQPDAITPPPPPPAPVAPASGARRKHERPATRPARLVRRPAPVTKPVVATAPTTRPAEPLEIFWTGTLTVRPTTPETTPVGGGKMVEFIGSPAHVAQGLSTVDARLIHVEPDAGLARVEPGGSITTISLHLGQATELRSRTALVVDRDAGVATIEGAGTMVTNDVAAATRPTTGPATASSSHGPTNVAWNKRMELRLENFGDDPLAPQWLDEISLEGDASVRSDTFAMNGDALTFNFDEPDDVPEKTSGDAMLATPDAKFLRFASADGHARVETGSADERRTLAGDLIELGLEEDNGGAALTSIVADDDVAMKDARGSELYCDHLDVGVEPIALATATTRAATTRGTTRPTTAATSKPVTADAFAFIDKLNATGSVLLKQPDGSLATGDTLTLDVADGRKTVALAGAPATAGSPKATLSSERLLLDPSTNDVTVPGAGQLVSIDRDKPGTTGTVTWVDSMHFTNDDATVKIDGGVRIDNRDASGSTLHATSDRVTLLLASTPTTRPAATTTSTTTKPSAAPSFDSIRSALLEGKVDVTVATEDYRHANVQTELLSIDVANNVVTADKPGRLYIFDQRHDPATRPSTQPATAPTTAPATEPTTQPATEPATQSTTAPVVQPATSEATSPAPSGSTMPTSVPTTASASQPTSAPTTGPTTRRVKPSTDYPVALAVAWKDKLHWDLLPGTMHLTGGVVVGYERGIVSGPVHITSDSLDATLAPLDLRTLNKSQSNAAPPDFELRTVHAFDDVFVRSRQSSFNAATLDYDLSSDLAHASGDAQRGVTLYDATGASSVGFSRITWNVQTGAITDFRDITGRIRR